ncbi:MAG: M20/M25/M40 family metallo-hydrolase, partial [Acidobacteriota bacterium]|nr:M20/M25/M40 family metallo-hydrolase [Acidobacteriota bacterium]
AAGLVLLSASSLIAQTQPPAEASAPLPAETRTAVRDLIGEVLVNGKALEYDRQLTDDVGPRLTGSANYNHAVTWALETLRGLGLSNVHTESFTMPALWEPETPATGSITTPRTQTLHIYSMGWSPSTPPGGVTGEVFYLPTIGAADTFKDRIAGHIVLIDNDTLGRGAGIAALVRDVAHVVEQKPLAVLMVGTTNGAEVADCLLYDGNISPVPGAQIGQEDDLLVRRLLQRGPVTIHFSMTNRTRPATEVQNVVAEIAGRELPGHTVLVGGHLDSWHPGTGAQDNGTGVATVLDVARSVMALGRPPRRTLRFVLFGGEEQGLFGSAGYVQQHRNEMATIDAVLISDTGAQPARGWYLMAREDQRPYLDPVEPLLAGLGANQLTADNVFLFETDHAGFDVLGVPTLVLWNDTDKYFRLHHQASDTFDSVVPADLAQGVATTAATAYAIADLPHPYAPHLTQQQMLDRIRDDNQLENYQAVQAVKWVP